MFLDSSTFSLTHMNAFQRMILLVILACLLGWFAWYIWTLLSGKHGLPKTVVKSSGPSRFQQAYFRLEQLGEQPQLESARLNFLRLLPYSEVRDMILVGLSTLGYSVDLQTKPTLYEFSKPDPEALTSDLIVPVEDHLEAPPYKGRLMRPISQVLANLNPPIETGLVRTLDHTPVMLSIQTEDATYSRIGLARLAEACELENQRGLLIYLGQSMPTVQPPPTVVLLSGPELLAILDGISINVE